MLKLVGTEGILEEDIPYSAAYFCGDGIFKVIRVGKGNYYTPEPSNLASQLEIQRGGLVVDFKSLSFNKGVIENYRDWSPIVNMRMDSVKTRCPEEAAKLMERFGNEFKEIFQMNERLRRYVPTHFADLAPYLR